MHVLYTGRQAPARSLALHPHEVKCLPLPSEFLHIEPRSQLMQFCIRRFDFAADLQIRTFVQTEKTKSERGVLPLGECEDSRFEIPTYASPLSAQKSLYNSLTRLERIK